MSGIIDSLVKSPSLQLRKAVIRTVDGDSVSLLVGGGVVYNVAYLDQYTPVEGAVVYCLSLENVGMLILGSSSVGDAFPPVSTPAPTVVTAASVATYNSATEGWTAGVAQQGPGLTACWFFPVGAFLAFVNVTPLSEANAPIFQSFEIELTRTSGGPARFYEHHNSTATGSPVLLDAPPFIPAQIPTGLATWIKLPIGWAADLANGIVLGIAISSPDPGVYSPTARIRFQPLSVTM